MKVAMIETGGWGGIAHYTWNLCQALAQEKANLVLLTNAWYELEALPSAFRIEPCFDPAVGFAQTARSLLRQLSAVNPDIVHVQSLISTRFDALFWPFVRRGRPVVITAHNVREHETARWASWTLWQCLRRADAVVVHTEESARVAAARLGPGARIRLIHHGDYAFFAEGAAGDREQARRLLDLPATARILLAFGAIRPYKGIRELIAALPQIRARHPDAYLVITGPLLMGSEEEYQEAIRQAGVEGEVAFRPHYVPHDSVAAYFRAADVAVYNYHDVTDSGSLRIACSLGTPVVATSVGGFGEFLTDGLTGRLAPPGDTSRLATVVSDVLDNPAAAARMASAAQALAASRFSWADSAAATLALYSELLAVNPSGPAGACRASDEANRSTAGHEPGGTHAG